MTSKFRMISSRNDFHLNERAARIFPKNEKWLAPPWQKCRSFAYVRFQLLYEIRKKTLGNEWWYFTKMGGIIWSMMNIFMICSVAGSRGGILDVVTYRSCHSFGFWCICIHNEGGWLVGPKNELRAARCIQKLDEFSWYFSVAQVTWPQAKHRTFQ